MKLWLQSCVQLVVKLHWVFFPFFEIHVQANKSVASARESLFECLRHCAKSHKLCGEEEVAAAENELKITSFIDITNTKWTMHVYYINSLQIVVWFASREGSQHCKRQHERFIDWNMTWKYQRVVWYILQIKYNVRDIIIARMSSCSISCIEQQWDLKSNACKLSNVLIYSTNDIVVDGWKREILSSSMSEGFSLTCDTFSLTKLPFTYQ